MVVGALLLQKFLTHVLGRVDTHLALGDRRDDGYLGGLGAIGLEDVLLPLVNSALGHFLRHGLVVIFGDLDLLDGPF